MCLLRDANKPLPKALVVNLLQLTHTFEGTWLENGDSNQHRNAIISSYFKYLFGQWFSNVSHQVFKSWSRSNQNRIWSGRVVTVLTRKKSNLNPSLEQVWNDPTVYHLKRPTYYQCPSQQSFYLDHSVACLKKSSVIKYLAETSQSKIALFWVQCLLDFSDSILCSFNSVFGSLP